MVFKNYLLRLHLPLLFIKISTIIIITIIATIIIIVIMRCYLTWN